MKIWFQSVSFFIAILTFFVSPAIAQKSYDTLNFYSSSISTQEMETRFESAIQTSSNYSFERAFLIANSFVAFAIDTKDSLVLSHAYHKLGLMHFQDTQNDSAFYYFNIALEIAQSKNDTLSEINIERSLGAVYLSARKRDHALMKFNRSFELAKMLSDSANMAKALNNLSILSSQTKDYANALRYLNRALDLKIAYAPKWEHISTLINIGNNYSNLGDYNKALEYLERAKVLAISYDKKVQLAEIWFHLANINHAKGDLKTAKESFKKSMDISTKINDFGHLKLTVKSYAEYLMEIGEWRLAESNLEAVLSELTEREHPLILSEIYYDLGKIAYETDNKLKARIWLNQAVSITHVPNEETLAKSYNLLANISYLSQDFEMSYHYLRISNLMSDSILRMEKNEKMEELMVKYNSVNDKKSIEQLLEITELKEKEKEKSTFYFLVTFSLFVITLSVAIALARQARIKHGQSIELKTQIEDNLKKTKDLMEANTLAEQGLKVKSEFIAMVSHEIRTPMNAIIGMSSLLSDTELSKTQRNYLNNISISSNNLLILLNDILDFSRVEARKVNIKLQPSDLKKELTHVVNMFEPLAVEKGLELEVEIDDNIPAVVYVDAPRIRQVVVNLLSNAIKFTHQGFVKWKVVLSATEPTLNGEIVTIRFEVSDSGIGVPKAKQKEIFSSFNQLDSKVSRQYSGVGLGLSISQGILGMMGTQIQLESEFAQGSTFWFELKAKSEKKMKLPISSSTNAKVKFDKELGLTCPLKILIAEDNEINQKLLKINLNKMGYNPVIVSNGQEALDQLKIQEFDVIFMDVQMPVMDGVTATKEIVRMYGNTKPIIIAVTANAMGTDKQSYIAAGMDDYISKPFTTQEIESCLRTWYVHLHN